MATTRLRGRLRGVAQRKRTIKNIYKKRTGTVFALARLYAAEALTYFQINQSDNRWWKNQTFAAATQFFTQAFIDRDRIGFTVAHGVSYGVYLTYANNRQNDAITPIMAKFAPKYLRAVKKLFKD